MRVARALALAAALSLSLPAARAGFSKYDYSGGGSGAKPPKHVHCTAEALGQEIEVANDAEAPPFTFESLGCKCEKADDVVFVSCPADADASYGVIGTKIDFRYAKLDNMTLEGANLEEAKFDYASCNGCSFAGATLDEADMDYMKASSANFTAATLDGADMVSACGRAL